jgi:hypothetical protein
MLHRQGNETEWIHTQLLLELSRTGWREVLKAHSVFRVLEVWY